MIDAGIEDPDSEEGALFCAGNRSNSIKSQCPYPVCVVFENSRTNRKEIVREKVRFSMQLHIRGVSVEDIALILSRKPETIRRYLRR